MFKGSQGGVGGAEVFEDHVAGLGHSGIEDEVASYAVGQCRTVEAGDEGEHEVGVGKGGAGGDDRAGVDNHAVD